MSFRPISARPGPLTNCQLVVKSRLTTYFICVMLWVFIVRPVASRISHVLPKRFDEMPALDRSAPVFLNEFGTRESGSDCTEL